MAPSTSSHDGQVLRVKGMSCRDDVQAVKGGVGGCKADLRQSGGAGGSEGSEGGHVKHVGI